MSKQLTVVFLNLTKTSKYIKFMSLLVDVSYSFTLNNGPYCEVLPNFLDITFITLDISFLL